MDIAKQLEETLKSQGRSKTWLSEQMDVNYKTLTGKFKRNGFDAVELIQIAKILNIDLNKFKEGIQDGK